MFYKYLPAISLAGLSLFAALLVSSSLQAGEVKKHPYHGKWTWVYNDCTEVYTVLPNGTASVTSGDETATSEYTASDMPDIQGFYHVTDTVTDSNGKTGCDGEPSGTDIGHSVNVFIKFNETQDQMLWCFKKSIASCIGPFYRVPE